jgi:hypothetical protein
MAKKQYKKATLEKSKTFDKKLFNTICEEISLSNRGLVTVCKAHKVNPVRFYEWIHQSEDLRKQYARARELQADFLADEIIELSSSERYTTENIEVETQEGFSTTEIKKDNYNRTRLEIDARKWKASKLYPKKYGERLDVTTDGEKINEVRTFNILPNDKGHTD